MIIMVNNHHLYEELLKITTNKNVLVNQPLKDYTYTRFGGQADYLVTPETYKEVQQIVKLANEHKIAFTLLGNGSNQIGRASCRERLYSSDAVDSGIVKETTDARVRSPVSSV